MTKQVDLCHFGVPSYLVGGIAEDGSTNDAKMNMATRLVLLGMMWVRFVVFADMVATYVAVRAQLMHLRQHQKIKDRSQKARCVVDR